MQISVKARLISIILAVVFISAALIGTGAYLIVNHLNKTIALSGNYTSIGDIFNGSSFNAGVCATLIDRIGDDNGGQSNLYNGTPIVFTMAGAEWQVVYRDTSENNDIITVWMTEPYTSDTFNSSSYNYSGSHIQTNLTNYYNSKLSAYSMLSQIVVTPDDVSSNYQTAQTQQYEVGGYTSVLGTLNDNEHFWLPSCYEIFSFWELDNTDRGFSDISLSSDCFLRSGAVGNGTCAIVVKSTGSSGIRNVYHTVGIRPACHISLSVLAEFASYSITVKSSNESYGTVSGGGVYAPDYTGTTTITATPNYGYVFDHWKDSAGNQFYNNPYTFPVTQTETYTAYFREPNLIITSANSGAEVAIKNEVIDDISYRYNLVFTDNNYIHSITVNSVPIQIISAQNGALITDDACTAINYNTNTTGSRLYLDIIGVSDDITITLTFTNVAQSFTPASGGTNIDGVALQVSASDNSTNLAAVGEARITGYNKTDGLTTIHVSALASTGYRFVGWQVDGKTISTLLSADISYSDVEGKILVAVFAPIDNSTQNSQTDNGYIDDFV